MRKSREVYGELVDHFPQMIFELDLDLHLSYANRCALNALGLSDQDLKAGIDALSFIDPSRHAKIRENLENSRKDLAYEPMECTALKKDGSRFPVVIYSAPIYRNNSLAGVGGVIVDLSEQKKNEVALKESEKRYRALFENANDAITLHGFSPDGLPTRFIDVNENACRLTEYTREELLSMNPMELDDPETWEDARRCMRTLQEQGHHVFERSHVRKDGTKIRVEISSHIFSLDNRKIALSIVRDITERKRVEEALRESEERFRALFENANDAITVNGFGPGGLPSRFIEVNENACKLSDYTREEMLSMTPLDLDDPDSWKESLVCAKILMEKGHHLFERTYVKRDGKKIRVEISAHVFPFRNQKLLLSIVRDITERKRAEEALRESEEKYRLLADNIQDVIWTADLDMRLTYISPSVTSLLGITPEEAMEGALSDALTEESLILRGERREKGLSEMQTSGPSHKSYVMDLEFRCKNGSTIWTELVISPVFDNCNSLVGIMGVMRDITSRKRAEEALRDANNKLNLLSSITRHDINNQLLVVNGFIDLLHIEIADPSFDDYFSRIMTASRRIADMIRFTGEYEKIGVEAPVWHDLATVLDIVIAEGCRPWEITFTSDLPAGIQVFADPMLNKAFFNMLDNVVRHGRHATRIRVSTHKSGKDLVIVMEDNGVGIADDEKERIFEHGYGKNTGLGLFLVREILSLTGITIKETGKEGAGARFEITVPKGAYSYPTETDIRH